MAQHEKTATQRAKLYNLMRRSQSDGTSVVGKLLSIKSEGVRRFTLKMANGKEYRMKGVPVVRKDGILVNEP